MAMFIFNHVYNFTGSIQSGLRDKERKQRWQLLCLFSKQKETEDCMLQLFFSFLYFSYSSFFPTSKTGAITRNLAPSAKFEDFQVEMVFS